MHLVCKHHRSRDNLTKIYCADTNPKLTRKKFSEKPIVAFTNSKVFILDFYIYD